MSNNVSVLSSLALIALLSGCASRPSVSVATVHAAGAPPAPVFCAAGNSAPEQFAHGTVRPDKSTVLETPEYLQFASPVCASSGMTMNSSYALQFNHQVQLIDMQMGSGESNSLHVGQPVGSEPGTSPELFEWAWWASFDTPDGRHYEFFQQYDKHSDVQGNQNVKIPLPHGLTLPAGTTVTLFRPPAAGTDGATQSHITGQKLELVGY